MDERWHVFKKMKHVRLPTIQRLPWPWEPSSTYPTIDKVVRIIVQLTSNIIKMLLTWCGISTVTLRYYNIYLVSMFPATWHVTLKVSLCSSVQSDILSVYSVLNSEWVNKGDISDTVLSDFFNPLLLFFDPCCTFLACLSTDSSIPEI